MEFFVESKYPLSIFTDNNLEVSWDTIWMGVLLNRLSAYEVNKFAMDFLDATTNTNGWISELVFKIEDEKLKNQLEKILKLLKLNPPHPNHPRWNKEWIKWRYCIMSNMVKKIKNNEKLLEAIEGIYADFGYPEDMTSFIYYMPQNESIPTSQDEARAKLVKNAKSFLQDQKKLIFSNPPIKTLPDRTIDIQ